MKEFNVIFAGNRAMLSGITLASMSICKRDPINRINIFVLTMDFTDINKLYTPILASDTDDIQKVIKSAVKQNIFKGAEIFDVYQGEHVEEGFKSVAYRIKMQDADATLTDEIIEQQMTSVREKLQKAYAQISFRE